MAMVGLLGYRTLVADRAGAQQFDQGPVRVGSPARFVEGGIHVGPKDAIVTVAEFADFECPACAAFSSDLKAVMEEHPQEIAYVFHHFPLRQHRFARPAARVAECAHEQGAFAAMQDLLFEKQDSLGLKRWVSYAEDAGVRDLPRFEACSESSDSIPRVEAGLALGAEIEVSGTPTVIINGWRYFHRPSAAELREAVKRIRRGDPPSPAADRR